MVVLTGCIAVALAAAHVFAGRLAFLSVVPRSRWLSMAGGVAVAYVFIHILPDLSNHQAALAAFAPVKFLEHHVYLIALAGLATFYGLERLVKSSRRPERAAAGETPAPAAVFWVHIGSFAAYNALVGYLLNHREESGTRSLILFGVAMALHFVVNDFGLRQDHKGTYDRVGRWVLAVAVVVGWGLGVGVNVHPAAVAALFAFLAGGTVLNVLKEELPEERESNFWAFLAGVTGYTVVLLAI